MPKFNDYSDDERRAEMETRHRGSFTEVQALIALVRRRTPQAAGRFSAFSLTYFIGAEKESYFR